MIKDLVLQYWYVGAAFSIVYTIGSLWWSWWADRAIRFLRAENRIQTLAYETLLDEVKCLRGYVEDGDTLRKINVVRLVPRKEA